MTAFQTTRTVRFADCDPAGIVFFPQYMVMANTLVEQWFDEGLAIDYAQMIATRRTGLPTVRLEVDFTAISHHGDRLTQRLFVEKLGRSSLTVRHEYLGGPDAAELRVRIRQVLVCTSLHTHRPQAFPDDMSSAIERCLETPA